MLKNLFKSTLVLMVALLGMTACNNGKGSCKNDCDANCKNLDRDLIYTGILPAADTDGIRYQLKLDYDDDANYTKGDYDLIETYIAADTTAVGGMKDLASYKSEGDFTVISENGKKYLKLIKDNKDSNPNASSPLYFEVANDSILTLVNSDLQRAESDLNYNLNLVK